MAPTPFAVRTEVRPEAVPAMPTWRTVITLLEKLGGTRAEVLATLTRGHCRGRRNSSTHCPAANWLRGELYGLGLLAPWHQVYVLGDEVVLAIDRKPLDQDPVWESVATAWHPPLGEFVEEFDRGAYSHLAEPQPWGTPEKPQ